MVLCLFLGLYFPISESVTWMCEDEREENLHDKSTCFLVRNWIFNLYESDGFEHNEDAVDGFRDGRSAHFPEPFAAEERVVTSHNSKTIFGALEDGDVSCEGFLAFEQRPAFLCHCGI